MNQSSSNVSAMVPDGVGRQSPSIYVVDDDADVLGSLRFLLETDGFDVRTFRSGAALLNGDRIRPTSTAS